MNGIQEEMGPWSSEDFKIVQGARDYTAGIPRWSHYLVIERFFKAPPTKSDDPYGSNGAF
jgi:hypothetical protein